MRGLAREDTLWEHSFLGGANADGVGKCYCTGRLRSNGRGHAPGGRTGQTESNRVKFEYFKSNLNTLNRFQYQRRAQSVAQTQPSATDKPSLATHHACRSFNASSAHSRRATAVEATPRTHHTRSENTPIAVSNVQTLPADQIQQAARCTDKATTYLHSCTAKRLRTNEHTRRARSN